MAHEGDTLLDWARQYQQERLLHLSETEAIATSLAECLHGGEIIGLSAPLGGGKTTFVQFLGQALGIQEPIVSPSFSLYDQYPLGDKLFVHFDLYRIENKAEFVNLDFEEIWLDPNAICLIEWPEIAEDVLPEPYVMLHLNYPPAMAHGEEIKGRHFYATIHGA